MNRGDQSLSIVIPARNEMFLAKTVQDILSHSEGDTDVIVVLDGQWADPPIADDKRVRVIYHSQSIGQRAATNEAVRTSDARYIMKVDAHCAFDQGFDRKMMEAIAGHDDWTMVPTMRNLHAFDWVCPAGHRRYQGPSGPCKEANCGKPTTRDVVWIPKPSPQSVSYCFDSEPHFQYFKEFSKRPEGQGDITPTMSLQGSCFMITREKYWELNICDEDFGSWGSQGIEVAVKTWLSGGSVMVNKKTWYAHMFRTQGGDFGFPYPQSGNQVSRAKKFAKSLFFENRWPKQVRPLSWLLERFWPVQGWSEADLKGIKEFDKNVKPKEDKAPPTLTIKVTDDTIAASIVKPKEELSKGIIFYTDNRLKLSIAHVVQKQLRGISAKRGIPIVSASLKPMGKMGKNIHLPLEPGRLTMFKQILAAIENSTSDIIFFCEHDVLYPESHFDFTPTYRNIFYYNQNFWKVGIDHDKAVHYDANQLSGMCCYRELALEEYQKRVERVQTEDWKSSMGYEPGTRGIHRGGISDYLWESWRSKEPLVDIRHSGNLTWQRWSKEQFRNPMNCINWTETTIDKVPGWTGLREIVK